MSTSLYQQLLSQKSRGYFDSSSYFDKNVTGKLQLSLDQSDKIMTLSHGYLAATVECLMIEGMASLLLGKHLKILWNLEFKEFENFLRDENHLPALFPPNSIFIETFEKITAEIISESLKQAIINRPELQYPLNKSGLVSQNRWGKSFCRYIGHELILIEGDELILKKNPHGMREADIRFALSSINETRTNWPLLKVVAVS